MQFLPRKLIFKKITRACEGNIRPLLHLKWNTSVCLNMLATAEIAYFAHLF